MLSWLVTHWWVFLVLGIVASVAALTIIVIDFAASLTAAFIRGVFGARNLPAVRMTRDHWSWTVLSTVACASWLILVLIGCNRFVE